MVRLIENGVYLLNRETLIEVKEGGSLNILKDGKEQAIYLSGSLILIVMRREKYNIL